jgi:acyl-CoA synthetase (AMP-forming)/AMP-acid ligase II
VVAASGSALPGELALRWMDTFGDNVYNFYGSTEVAQASIAMPDELRAVPGTAGRPPRGTIVKIIDADGREVPQGTTGRIFVANENQFEGYTGGGNKEVIQGLMSSGDVGHFDANGLLFVDGRDDDMIISGGENVFPREVEDLLATHPAVREAAVLGVPDSEFGQRLKAFVVLEQPGQVGAEDLKQHVRTHLARYKVPREIVLLPELPRNPTGKVLKRVLRELVIEVRRES